ncbi:hypothetical protein D1007_09787 [Hordeum vulgare]|nr:hypothetical protein D1007_09787 [Hordeum vulgare]
MVVVDPQPDNVGAADDVPANAASVDHAPPNVEDVVDDAPEESSPLAIVPYQQPILRLVNLMIGAVHVAYGPPLPPVVSWERSFEALMEVFSSLHVPYHIQMPAAMHIVLPECSWSIAFDEDRGEPSNVYKDCIPTP